MSQWREIEVERVDGDERDLRRIGKQLRSAGATPSTTGSKLRRALSQRAPAEPAAGSVNELVTSYLRAQATALVAGDVALRRGLDRVHRTRVAARRIRSVLRVFRQVLDADRADQLDRELSWFQDLLGVARDAQVQRARLTDAVAQLPPELVLGPVVADVKSALVATQAVALDEVRTAMQSDRYLDLLRAVRSWTDDPPLRPDTSVADLRRLGKRAERRSRRRLRRGVERGGQDLHRARKAAKRSRYAMELLRPALGSTARKSIKRHKALQDVLGDYQDSVVASSHLRRLGAAGGARGRNGFTYGLLFAHEEQQRRLLLRKVERARL